MKRKRKIDPNLRASVYILFSALNNLVVALDEAKDERNDDLEYITKTLARKLGFYIANKKLQADFQRDVTAVMRGLTGYQTTNPAMLALSLLIHYREMPRKQIEFDGLFWQTVYKLDGQVFDVEKKKLDHKYQKLIDISVEAGDLIASGVRRYVAENYR